MFKRMCKHECNLEDMINIESLLPEFIDCPNYMDDLLYWRIICPCRKCGKVLHAHCGVDLPCTLTRRGE